MTKVIHVDRDDEIADLVSRVRGVDGSEVALVLPDDAAVFHTPLNVRLLSQFAAKDGRTLSIVSADPRIQQLAKLSGFPTYASVSALERGIEVVKPHREEAALAAAEHGGGVAVATPPATTAVATRPAGAPPGAASGGRAPVIVRAHTGGERRRPLYFGLIALGVVGFILFIILSPSAKIRVTLNTIPVSASPTIRGTPDPTEAKQPDQFLTQVLTDNASLQFQVAATGTSQTPAGPAAGQMRISANPKYAGYSADVLKGTQFMSTDGQTFVTTQDELVPIGPDGAGSPLIPVQAATAGAKGNVGANTITQYPQCAKSPDCTQLGITVTNPSATSGGTDPKTVTVVSDQDLGGWNAQVQQLEKHLTDKVNADLLSKGTGRQFAVDPGGGGKTISFDVQPPLPATGAAFGPGTVTVSVHAKATLYSVDDVKKLLLTDLQQQVPAGNSLIPDKLVMTPIQVIQASDDGHVAMSVTATDYHRPDVNLDDLRSVVTGKSPDDARRLIMHRVDRVQSVEIDETPFNLFFLPFFSSRIQIIETFVTQPPTAKP